MNTQLTEKFTSIIDNMDASDAEQLNELFTCYIELDKGNRQEIIEHAKLYHSAIQLLKGPQ